jgi:ribosomal protein L37E
VPERRRLRFLHLERRRPERPPEEGPAQSAGRFEAVRRPPGTGAPPAARTGATLERFGPEPEPSIELAPADGGHLPFQRCQRCGMDSHVFATACAGCGTSLDTEAQRTFDAQLHAERQADAAREAAASVEREALRARGEAEDARARRALYEGLAREVGERERRRLDGEGLLGLGAFGRTSRGWHATPSRPVVRLLLRFVRSPAGVVLAAALLLAAGRCARP